ncbi:hypothetical protein Barb7_01786 [Bacteroidales bacterium Barb7]|nr:hypothetical protein Barb7_01786 [Bacteroidales bacterium Barb7]
MSSLRDLADWTLSSVRKLKHTVNKVLSLRDIKINLFTKLSLKRPSIKIKRAVLQSMK